MMNKIWKIARRECAVRMNKPMFWMLSFLGPLILILMSVLPYAITSNFQDKKTMLVNAPRQLAETFPLTIGPYDLHFQDTTSHDAIGLFLAGNQQLMCDLSTSKDSSWTLYSKAVLQPADSLNIIRTLSLINLQGENNCRVVNLKTESEHDFSSTLQQTIAILACIVVYFFLFTYSVSLLKGVMEEKGNKVIDLILSSVSPSSWIMGKIAGIGIASLVQFTLWLTISYVPFYFFNVKYGSALQTFSSENIHQVLSNTESADMGQALGWYEWLQAMNNVQWFTLFITMLLSMVFGFILYAAVFAIVGMLAGRESDAQPYVLPVTAPLILSFISSGAVIAEPYGDAANILTAIPFTAPLILTLRAALGVELGDLLTSVGVLVLTSIWMVIVAGKIYKRMLNKGGQIFSLLK